MFTIVLINTIETMNFKPSKILVCVGTCAELIKCAPVIKSLEERGVELVVVNLGAAQILFCKSGDQVWDGSAEFMLR